MGTGWQVFLVLKLRYHKNHTFLNTCELERFDVPCAWHACGDMDWTVCNDAVVAASAWAIRPFSCSSGATRMKVKENLGEAV